MNKGTCHHMSQLQIPPVVHRTAGGGGIRGPPWTLNMSFASFHIVRTVDHWKKMLEGNWIISWKDQYDQWWKWGSGYNFPLSAFKYLGLSHGLNTWNVVGYVVSSIYIFGSGWISNSQKAHLTFEKCSPHQAISGFKANPQKLSGMRRKEKGTMQSIQLYPTESQPFYCIHDMLRMYAPTHIKPHTLIQRPTTFAQLREVRSNGCLVTWHSCCRPRGNHATRPRTRAEMMGRNMYSRN